MQKLLILSVTGLMLICGGYIPGMSVSAQNTTSSSTQNSRRISGVVTDTQGEPIIGASVVEAGTTNGIVTDLDGNFKLNVSAKGSLKISFIGYQTQTIPVAGKKQFDITLKEDAKVLDEVVVVGYGQMKRSDLTGSVVSVNDEAIKKSVVTSVD